MLLLVFSILNLAFGSGLKTMDPVGAHYPIITFEKNENPQNIMIIYTKLDKNCHVEHDGDDKDKPVFAFYWMMDHAHYKRVHPMIRSGIRDRLKVGKAESDGFKVEIADLKELKSDIQDPTLKVTAKKNPDGSCMVDATMTLGSSDKGRSISLKTIYSEAKKTFWPPFRKLISVRLDGKDVKDGTDVQRKYTAN